MDGPSADIAWSQHKTTIKDKNTENVDFIQKNWYLLEAKRYFVENSFDFKVSSNYSLMSEIPDYGANVEVSNNF